ncbi:hypothetical protein ACOZ4N_11040 [Halorientalis pallida]|uniref:hypothetical protein n=1 Tax=Halorientalis pallida TaxID=2479928 RepID=UPI003C6F22DA
MISKRSFLGGVATGIVSLSAGCFASETSGLGATDVIIHNEATEQRTIEIRVVDRADETTAIESSVKMSPHTRHRFNNQVTEQSDYRVRIQVTEGTSEMYGTDKTRMWTDADTPLHVIVHERIVFAVQINAE